jgi:hypothetical protein
MVSVPAQVELACIKYIKVTGGAMSENPRGSLARQKMGVAMRWRRMWTRTVLSFHLHKG